MARIASEAEWLSCDEPRDLAQFVRDRLDARRFRWLAAEWGARIRPLFESDDRAWFDAFARWVAGGGPHPAEVCSPDVYLPFDNHLPATFWARRCADAIRQDDPLSAAAYAGAAASEHFPFVPPPEPDYAHTHRGRAAARRAADQARKNAHRAAWEAARADHEARVRREFCDQFRDVAGNPFRPVRFDPAWRTEAAVALARGIDVDRALDRLPVLADALEAAGCTVADVLAHCRGDGPHVRGCWVVDRVLGTG